VRVTARSEKWTRRPMKRWGGILAVPVLLLLLFPSGQCLGAYDYIDIRNPFLRKIPLAVPRFKVLAGGEEAETASLRGADLTAQTLAFTGFFNVLDREAFIVDPQKSGITVETVNFANWTSVGAELLVTGGIAMREGGLDLELRLLDTFQARLLVGKRYRGQMSDLVRMIRLFCGEVVYFLTRTRGIFDTQIAFVSTTPGNKEVYICDFDGSQPRQITRGSVIALSPAWSSDGKYLSYTAYKKGGPHLYIYDLESKRGTVVDYEGVNIGPAWTPGRFELAATLSHTGDPEIYLLTGKGEIIKRLTTSWGIDVSPSWSPDGKKIAFVSTRSGSPQIHVKDLDSDQVERITFQGRNNTSPSWGPRGDRIAYVSLEDGGSNIYTVGVHGENRTRLTTKTGSNESPSWSPDGTLIVFSSNRQGPYRIYVMTAQGTEQRPLLSLPGQQTDPSWSPRASGP